ncbi:MAG: hypothetical protein L6Q94_14755 [Calditrichia bacterium]|nr:hypothetical protein [Calditrichia bacterium]
MILLGMMAGEPKIENLRDKNFMSNKESQIAIILIGEKMYFDPHDLLESGFHTLFILLAQIILLVIGIVNIMKPQKKLGFQYRTYLLFSIIQFTAIISIFFHQLKGIELFKATYVFDKSVHPLSILGGMEKWQVFITYELLIGIICFFLVIFLFYRKDKS